MQIPKRRSDALRKPDDGPVHLTEAGFERLKDRLAALKRALPDRIAEAQRTAAYGDRSDNAEYKESKSILRRTHRQIFAIEDQIKRVVVIPTGTNAAGTVRLGSVVVMELAGKEKIFHIVGPQETNPTRSRISQLSPLGAALIGHAQGETVTIQTGNGPQEYRIIEVR